MQLETTNLSKTTEVLQGKKSLVGHFSREKGPSDLLSHLIHWLQELLEHSLYLALVTQSALDTLKKLQKLEPKKFTITETPQDRGKIHWLLTEQNVSKQGLCWLCSSQLTLPL